jgi:riboflavin kinase/FMN adenylyltransferase
MQVFHSLEELPAGFGPSVVGIGNFDGVHRAHAHMLRTIVESARAQGMQSVAVSFEPHPGKVLRPDGKLKLLTPAQEKIRLLAAIGLDFLLLLPFTGELSAMPARQFAHLVLEVGLQAREVHEGYNFRFGHKAEGNVDRLSEFGREMEFSVKLYPEMRLRGEPVSSSHIRDLLRAGEVGAARRLLGRPFSIVSGPQAGRGYGSKYTVPTINLRPYLELLPNDGVYVTCTRVGNEDFDSVTNLGNRPTFGADSFAIETHLLDFHPLELAADTPVEIAFLLRLRDEIKFASSEELRQQIGRDVERARRYFRRLHRLFP